MKTHRNIDLHTFEKTVVTVGVFDGVHLGHRLIISKLISEAERLGASSVLFTLHPHPKSVLCPEKFVPQDITTVEEKADEISKLGVEHLVIYPFSKSFAGLTACEFVRDILVGKLKACKIIVGYDHHFGSDRNSDIESLRACLEPYDCSIERAEAYVEDDVTVSSTLVRRLINEGDVVKANHYLSYTYSLCGVVEDGDKIGRRLGFPTANLKVNSDKIIPANGVYAVRVLAEGRLYGGMINIGYRPTVSKLGEKRVEVHLFDFSSDLYGKEVRVFFEDFVRKEEAFKSIDDLKEQLIADRGKVRQLLAN